jgi:uncharacterized membrane protein YkvA (DUF1232 family)
MNQNIPNNLPEIPGSQGFFHQAALRIKLFFRMMKDPRINIFLKLVPIAGLIYLISPIDFLPIPLLPIDDAAVVSLTFYLFIELSPKEVIDELMQELKNLDATNIKTQKAADIIEGIISNKEERNTEN